MVARIPAPRGDHGENKDSALTEQFFISVRIALADIFGDMGEVELDGPTATRLQIDEQQPSPRTKHVARVRLAVQQLLGAELEAETWMWDGSNWVSENSSGAGPLDRLGPLQTGGHLGDVPAPFAYGRAPGCREITISFDGHPHQVPVSRYGVWAFIKTRTSPVGQGFRSPVA